LTRPPLQRWTRQHTPADCALFDCAFAVAGDFAPHIQDVALAISSSSPDASESMLSVNADDSLGSQDLFYVSHAPNGFYVLADTQV
jgi:hypothetical protein